MSHTPQTVEAPVTLGEAQRVALPGWRQNTDGIGVPGQHQATAALPATGEQVELARLHLLQFAKPSSPSHSASCSIPTARFDDPSFGWVQLTEGVAISAASCSCREGRAWGLSGSLGPSWCLDYRRGNHRYRRRQGHQRKMPRRMKKNRIDRPAPTGRVITQDMKIEPITPRFSAPIPRAIPTPTAPTRV